MTNLDASKPFACSNSKLKMGGGDGKIMLVYVKMMHIARILIKHETGFTESSTV